MSFAGKLARGLLAGAAGYYGKVSDAQIEERKQAALLDREKALAQFRSGLSKDEKTHSGKVEGDLYESKVAAETAGKAALIEPEKKAKIEVNEAAEVARLRRDLTLAGVKFKHDATLTQLREAAETARTRIRESGQDRRQEDEQQHDVDTKPVMTVENADGEPTAVFGAGARNRTLTARGGKSKGGKEEDDGSVLGRAGGRNAAPPAKAPAAKAPAAPSYRDWDVLKADSARHPDFKNMPVPERLRALRALAIRQGIPVRPGD